MESKLIIIVIVWLAALGGLFLFSQNSKPAKNNLEYANIVRQVAIVSSTPNPTKIAVKTGKLNLTTTATLPTTTPPTTTTTKVTATTTLNTTTISIPQMTVTSITTSTPVPSTNILITTTIVQQSQKININTANNQELEKIIGVGPVIAQRIIDYRNTNGPFQKIEDIKNVNGIGDAKFEKMKNEITL